MADLSGWQKALFKFRPKLEAKVKIEHIISSLHEAVPGGFLTSREEQGIMSQSSDIRRVRKLVDILVTKDEKAFEAFVTFLKVNGQAELAEKLESAAMKEAPKEAQFPLSLRRQESFTCFIDKLLKIIQALSSQQRKQLSTFMQSVLYPSVPEGTPPVLPSSSMMLMKHVEQYCDPLNLGLLKILSKHLKNDDLTRQLEECERTLSDQLKQATWNTEVNVTPPPTYRVVLVKMKQADNTTVREAVEVRDILAENFMFKGDHGILYLAGLANDSLVFYVAEGNLGPMIQRMQHEREKMLASGVEQVVFVKLAKMDVASGNIVPHPDVAKRDLAEECPEFRVLLIGETGSGKSTLINNLLGEEVADEGHSLGPETTTIREYRSKIADVPITLYDTPGLNDMTPTADRDLCKEMKSMITSKKICLTIFCFSMEGKRLRSNHIETMRCYHGASVDWNRTIVALTFADKVTASRKERKSEEFDESAHFKRTIEEWKTGITDALVQKVGVPQSVAKSLLMRPTMDERDSVLQDNQEWFVPLWLDILDLLEPAPYFRFLHIHQDNIRFDGASNVSGGLIKRNEDKYRFKRIMENKMAILTGCSAATGIAAGVAAGVTFAGIATAPIWMPIAGVVICFAGAGGTIYGIKKLTESDNKVGKQEE